MSWRQNQLDQKIYLEHLMQIPLYFPPMLLVCTLHLGRSMFSSTPRGSLETRAPVFSYSCCSQILTWGSAPLRSRRNNFKACIDHVFLNIVYFPIHQIYARLWVQWFVHWSNLTDHSPGKFSVNGNGWQQWWTISIAWTSHSKSPSIRGKNVFF